MMTDNNICELKSPSNDTTDSHQQKLIEWMIAGLDPQMDLFHLGQYCLPCRIGFY